MGDSDSANSGGNQQSDFSKFVGDLKLGETFTQFGRRLMADFADNNRGTFGGWGWLAEKADANFGRPDETSAEGVVAKVGATALLLGMNPRGGAKRAGADAVAYSVAFETKIAKTGAGTREAHKMLANRELNASLAKDAEFSKMLSGMGIGPVSGAGTPMGFRWHHVKDQPGVMQLVPTTQHSPGSIFQNVLHPGGSGGFANWGKQW